MKLEKNKYNFILYKKKETTKRLCYFKMEQIKLQKTTTKGTNKKLRKKKGKTSVAGSL